MADGIKLHQKIQASQGIDYISEVTLKTIYHTHSDTHTDDKIELTISGRADGVLETEEGFTIDEIKGLSMSLDDVSEETFPLHWAQAKMYAYIFVLENELDHIRVQLTYGGFESQEIKRFKRIYTREALVDFYDTTLKQYEKWLKLQIAWKRERNETIDRLAFPFETYRKGQRVMAVAVYQAIKQEKSRFIEAPTGIGKTMSTLFPSIKALGEGYADKLFYLSAKAITKGVAEEAIERLSSRGLKIKYITLTAKDKLCFLEKATCYPDKCPYAKGHFDRVNDALYEIITTESAYTREKIERVSEKHTICPYEFSLDLAMHADIVICDYNYAFDPRVYLRRFFEMPTEAYIFLIDEAHNLVDRARTMFSATLSKEKVMAVKRAIGEGERHLRKPLDAINRMILDVRKKCDESGLYVDNVEIQDIYTQLRRQASKIESWLVTAHGFYAYDDVLDLYFDILSYMRISELYNEGYLFYIKEGNTSHTELTLFCINPALNLKRFINNSRSCIFFSATLTPIDYFKKLLAPEEDVTAIKLPSPFEPSHKLSLVAKNISVKYRDREKSKASICTYIHALVTEKCGNYLVFCPSYKYLDEVSTLFGSLYQDEVNLIVQSRQMDSDEREDFLATFNERMAEHTRENESKSLVAFAVLGGIFSEGIDLKGERLIGTVIVGVGLPMISFENNLVKAYFDDAEGKGYAYAYQYPGINKVMQAAGRVIRGEHDKGIILFIDTRFLEASYVNVFKDAYPQIPVDEPQMIAHIKSFWQA
jgi:DNA excision repair protein ERCC-2